MACSSSLIVTALFDLSSFEQNTTRRPIEWYMKHVDFTLGQPHPMVIFTESKLIDSIRAKRTALVGSDVPTDYFVQEIHTLPFFNDLDLHYKLRSNISTKPFINDVDVKPNAKLTVAYFMLVWNKFEFVKRAVERRPFYDSYVWMDMGIGAVASSNVTQAMFKTILQHTRPDRFECTIINPIVEAEFHDLDTYFKHWRWRVSGGFWSIGSKEWNNFYSTIHEQWVAMVYSGHLGACEELIARYVYLCPQRCVFFFGDYASCISNRVGLYHDLQVAYRCIARADCNNLHHIAAAGYEQLLVSLGLNMKHENFATMVIWLLRWFSHMYYVDFVKSCEIARFILGLGSLNDQFKAQLEKNLKFLKVMFAFVQIDPIINSPFYSGPGRVASILEKNVRSFVKENQTKLITEDQRNFTREKQSNLIKEKQSNFIKEKQTVLEKAESDRVPVNSKDIECGERLSSMPGVVTGTDDSSDIRKG